jgi:Fuc2NAc and GlcNAc transferase
MSVAVLLGLTDLRVVACLGSGMVILGAIGWLDDRQGVRPRIRLGVHILVAAATVYVFGGLADLRVGGRMIALGPFGAVLATIGIVWSINLFNFMDGLDGFAGSQALMIFGTAAGLFFYLGDVSLGILSAVFCAASAGFLFWNWPPARIFLGDVGSGPLGYLVGSLAVASEAKRSIPLLVFAIIGGVFVFDATVTLIRRLLRRRRLSEAHRDHAYQRLTRVFGTHRAVTLGSIAVTLCLSILAVVATLNSAFIPGALVLSALLLGGLMIATERRAPM